jgi:hypothetical protein
VRDVVLRVGVEGQETGTRTAPALTVDEEPIIDPAWLRRKAAQCMDLARVAVVPEVINGLAALALELETKARALEAAS